MDATSREPAQRRGVASLVARLVVVAAIVGSAIQAVWAARGVYADGAWFTWTVLSTDQFAIHISRAVVHFVTQFPLVLAMNYGVDDVGVLLRFQTFGSGALAILIWALALVVLLRDRLFWSMVVIFSVVFLNTGFMSIGEYNLAYAGVALAAALLLRDGPLLRGARTGLVLTGILLLATYESMVMLGPVLVLIALLRVRRDDLDHGGSSRWSYWSVVIASALYVVATVIAAINIIFPRDAGNLGGAANLIDILKLDRELLITVVAGLAFFALLVLLPARWRVLAGVVLLVPAVALLVRPDWWAHPWMHYSARTVVGLAMAVMLVLIVIAQVRERRAGAPKAASPRRVPAWPAAVGPAAIFAAMLVPVVIHTFGFASWLQQFDLEASAPGGVVALEDTALDPAATSDYGWPWTNGFLSRLLQEDDGDTIILSPGLTPETAGDLPGPLPDRFDSPPVLP